MLLRPNESICIQGPFLAPVGRQQQMSGDLGAAPEGWGDSAGKHGLLQNPPPPPSERAGWVQQPYSHILIFLALFPAQHCKD